MKNEKFLEAMENINDDLILSAMEEPAEKTNAKPFRKVKWTVLAACLALVLAIPAVAYMFGFTVEFDTDNSVWGGYTDARFDVGEFSETVQDLSESKHYAFNSLVEAEAFLGVNFPDNEILENGVPGRIVWESPSGERTEGSCGIDLGYSDGVFMGAQIDASYNTEVGNVYIHYSLVSKDNPHENGGGFGFVIDEQVEKEEYITASGRRCEIINYYDETLHYYQCIAFTEADRVLVTLRTSGQDSETARNTIVGILEAYK